MTGEYIDERNRGYYVADSRISLDSVVYSFERGNSPKESRRSTAAQAAQIYGAIAFYPTIRRTSAATSMPKEEWKFDVASQSLESAK